jgi:hypothetical protein
MCGAMNIPVDPELPGACTVPETTDSYGTVPVADLTVLTAASTGTECRGPAPRREPEDRNGRICSPALSPLRAPHTIHFRLSGNGLFCFCYFTRLFVNSK